MGGISSASPTGPGHGAADANSAAGAGISLAACSSRDLCLLMWSLASVGACPPALLRVATRTLRQRGVVGLSVQSMTSILTAQQVNSSDVSCRSDSSSANGSIDGEASGGGGGAWDLELVDALGAELALRWQQQQQQQQQQREEGKPLRLNPLDCCILSRCFALAWRQAAEAKELAASGTSPGECACTPPPALGGWKCYINYSTRRMHGLL